MHLETALMLRADNSYLVENCDVASAAATISSVAAAWGPHEEVWEQQIEDIRS